MSYLSEAAVVLSEAAVVLSEAAVVLSDIDDARLLKAHSILKVRLR